MQKMKTAIIFSCFILIAIIATGCNANKIKFTFADETGPIKNTGFIVQERILCKEGGECKPPVLFKGKTNNDGITYLDKKIIWGNNILVEGHYVLPIFRGVSQTEPHNVYDENLIVIGNTTYNLSQTKEITLVFGKLR